MFRGTTRTLSFYRPSPSWRKIWDLLLQQSSQMSRTGHYEKHTTMKRQLHLAALACAALTKETTLAAELTADDDDYQSRIHQAKLDLWLRGELAYDYASGADASTTAANLEMQVATASFRHGPIREVRQRLYGSSCRGESCLEDLLGIRGGGGVEYVTRLEEQLADL